MTDDMQHYSQDPPGDYGSPGEATVTIKDALDAILHALINPPVRPGAQIALFCPGGASSTNVFSTHVRFVITSMVFFNAVGTNCNLVAGVSKIIQNIAPGQPTVFPMYQIIDAGVDLSIVTASGAALFGAQDSTILLIGEIIN
jgi:hypothetical protein